MIAEACFVLESFYKKERQDIAKTLEVFLAQKWLEIEEREVLLNLLCWYKEGRHFVDSYLLACAKKEKGRILGIILKSVVKSGNSPHNIGTNLIQSPDE